jgi:hypothetical protein
MRFDQLDMCQLVEGCAATPWAARFIRASKCIIDAPHRGPYRASTSATGHAQAGCSASFLWIRLGHVSWYDWLREETKEISIEIQGKKGSGSPPPLIFPLP